MSRNCSNCAFWGDGFQDDKVNFCHAEEDYRPPDYSCPFFYPSSRKKKVRRDFPLTTSAT
jgi:hypothetical protein